MKKALIVSAVLVLAACGGGSDDDDFVPTPPQVDPPAPAPENSSFEISVVNLTSGQPVSPLAVIAHETDYQAFGIGEPASAALEVLAESGDNSQLLDELQDTARATVSGSAPLPPGASETLTLELDSAQTTGLHLTLLTMLVNTNDAITGVNGTELGSLAVNESLTLSTIAYDSGTEANSESAATVPGPAAGGEGFNAVRDDIRDQVTMHGGVVTADDGLGTSALNQQHRWDNPVLRVRITRLR